ncbi:MAG: DNA starvation/stationary phase protection protein [Opitutales bacterium]|nr:DNA starvation/stationary phase protection protein [Opitutales bacterium]
MSKKDLVSAMNCNLADLHVINIKLHNYHWNVSGLQFFGIHELTEKYYEYFFGFFDDVAERILQKGSKPFAKVKDYLDNASLKEESGDCFTAEQVLKAVEADFEVLLKDAQKINGMADEAGDIPTGNLYGDHIQWLEKALWMIRSTLPKAPKASKASASKKS